jgi:hypothetical protein
MDCTKLNNIILPNNIKSMGSGAFSGCDSLVYNEYDNGLYLGSNNNKYIILMQATDENITSCNIHKDTYFIGSYAFAYCTELENIVIPDNVISIHSGAFYYCNSLLSIVMPNTIQSIGSHAFYMCNSLEIIYYKGSYEQWNNINIDHSSYSSLSNDNQSIDNAKKIFNYAQELETLLGDINGDGEINNKDVVTLFRYVSGGDKAEDESIYDYNKDDNVDNKDVVFLFRAVSDTNNINE